MLENFSTGVMAKFGLDYETVAAANPMLIYASVSAYGRDGALRDRLGFDPITQAESGFMSMNGEPDRVGLRTGPSIMDMSTAMMTCNAVLAALFARERLGCGQFIEYALFDTAVTMVGFHAMNYLVSGDEPTRVATTAAIPFRLRRWRRRTGRSTSPAPTIGRGSGWRSGAGASGPCRTPRLRENAGARAQPRCAAGDHRRHSANPTARLLVAENACGRRAGRGDQFDCRSVWFGGDAGTWMVHAIPHPVVGSVPNIRLPFQLHGTPLADPVAAPGLGQNATEILGDVLGYDAAQIEALMESGAVVRPAD